MMENTLFGHYVAYFEIRCVTVRSCKKLTCGPGESCAPIPSCQEHNKRCICVIRLYSCVCCTHPLSRLLYKRRAHAFDVSCVYCIYAQGSCVVCSCVVCSCVCCIFTHLLFPYVLNRKCPKSCQQCACSKMYLSLYRRLTIIVLWYINLDTCQYVDWMGALMVTNVWQPVKGYVICYIWLSAL